MSTFDRLADLSPERVRPLRRVEFERLVDAGAFDDERVELLGGAIVEMSPQHPRHAAVVQRLTKILARVAGDGAELRPQLPFAASNESLPEPDLALVPPGDYDSAHPTRASLVVEVADSSLRKDRLVKAEIYARADVPEYWLVNLNEGLVEIHTGPLDGVYTHVRLVSRTATISLVAIEGATVNVADFLK